MEKGSKMHAKITVCNSRNIFADGEEHVCGAWGLSIRVHILLLTSSKLRSQTRIIKKQKAIPWFIRICTAIYFHFLKSWEYNSKYPESVNETVNKVIAL